TFNTEVMKTEQPIRVKIMRPVKRCSRMPKNLGCSPGAEHSDSSFRLFTCEMESTVAATNHGRPITEHTPSIKPTTNRSSSLKLRATVPPVSLRLSEICHSVGKRGDLTLFLKRAYNRDTVSQFLMILVVVLFKQGLPDPPSGILSYRAGDLMLIQNHLVLSMERVPPRSTTASSSPQKYVSADAAVLLDKTRLKKQACGKRKKTLTGRVFFFKW
ncbi:unnamed protein product, partial [Menidia menidia]